MADSSRSTGLSAGENAEDVLISDMVGIRSRRGCSCGCVVAINVPSLISIYGQLRYCDNHTAVFTIAGGRTAHLHILLPVSGIEDELSYRLGKLASGRQTEERWHNPHILSPRSSLRLSVISVVVPLYLAIMRLSRMSISPFVLVITRSFPTGSSLFYLILIALFARMVLIPLFAL